jgi:hypothetical protein
MRHIPFLLGTSTSILGLMAFKVLINSFSLTGESNQYGNFASSLKFMHNLFKEAAGAESGLYERFIETISAIG